MSDTQLLALLAAIAWTKGNVNSDAASAMAMEFVLQARKKAKLMAATDKLLGREEAVTANNPERDKLARELAEAWLSPATDNHTPEQLDEVARKLLRWL